jgi:formyltetrahydrofolate-dependent phosphoribosylglycinamide formyltransferase
VAVNGDASVRALKGPTRPINGEKDRAEVLAALECVAYVTIFPTMRVTDLVTVIRPQIYAKGGDYTVESLNPEERAALEGAGSEIRILGLVAGKSTTAIIEKSKKPGPLRLGVLGSGKGSNYRAIEEAIRRGEINAETRVVISDVEGAGILEAARGYGVRAEYVAPGRYRTKLEPEAEERVAALLREAGVELVVLAGYMRMVKAPLLGAYRGRIINIHPALLPAFPGLDAWKQALGAGVAETGCTVHYVDEGMDTGPIIAQRTVPVLAGDTPETLHARIQAAEHEVYPAVVRGIAEGR